MEELEAEREAKVNASEDNAGVAVGLGASKDEGSHAEHDPS
jgi:hypothetical protein